MELAPHSTRGSIIETIVKRQSELNISDEELASAFGQQNVTVITLFKCGQMKLPIRRVPVIASILAIDPAVLFRHVLSEYMPDVLEMIDTLSMPSNIIQS